MSTVYSKAIAKSLRRGPMPSFEGPMERGRLGITQQAGDFSDREHRVGEEGFRRLPARGVAQRLLRNTLFRESPLQRARGHGQASRHGLDPRVVVGDASRQQAPNLEHRALLDRVTGEDVRGLSLERFS